MRNPLHNPNVRAAMYALGGAVFILLGVYDLITEKQATAWMSVLGAALSLLALLNTPYGSKDSTNGE